MKTPQTFVSRAHVFTKIHDTYFIIQTTKYMYQPCILESFHLAKQPLL